MTERPPYPCPLDSRVTVLEVPFGESSHGLAYLIKAGESAVIVVDSNIRSEPWFTEDHLTAIFAHEMGHYHMGEKEEDAEMWAIDHCVNEGYDVSAALLRERGIV